METAIRSEELAVVGLVEVLRHLPRIWGEFQKLLRAVRSRKPSLAILTDSPDFHLRVAAKLTIPVVYLIAPQVWAWRKGRLKTIRRVVRTVLCIFPFEEPFFAENGVRARYIGHPLVGVVKAATSPEEFRAKHAIPADRKLVAILPGSRRGESERHMGPLLGAVELLGREFQAHFILPASPNAGTAFFRERIGSAPIQVLEGEAWDAMAHADVILAASGTVTVEAALLGAPMVVFYRVNRLSWAMGRMLVKVPFFSMVNLIAEKRVVTELIQGQMTPEALAGHAAELLRSEAKRRTMKEELAAVRRRLEFEGSAMGRAADEVVRVWEESVV